MFFCRDADGNKKKKDEKRTKKRGRRRGRQGCEVGLSSLEEGGVDMVMVKRNITSTNVSWVTFWAGQ